MANEGEGCPRCGGRVYAAEEVLARGRVSNIWNLKKQCMHAKPYTNVFVYNLKCIFSKCIFGLRVETGDSKEKYYFLVQQTLNCLFKS